MKVKDLFKKRRSSMLADGIAFCIEHCFTCLFLEVYNKEGKERASYVNDVEIKGRSYQLQLDYNEGEWRLRVVSNDQCIYTIHGKVVSKMIQNFLDAIN